MSFSAVERYHIWYIYLKFTFLPWFTLPAWRNKLSSQLVSALREENLVHQQVMTERLGLLDLNP